MHFRIAALALAVGLGTAVPARSEVTVVRVHIPFNLRAGFSTTAPAKDGQKYVTVDNVLVRNPSQYMAQAYEPNQFHLIVGEKVYVPVVRPGLQSLDLSTAGILAPHQSLNATVSFRVPESVTEAKFEFLPHWFDDAGFNLEFCCDYR